MKQTNMLSSRSTARYIYGGVAFILTWLLLRQINTSQTFYGVRRPWNAGQIQQIQEEFAEAIPARISDEEFAVSTTTAIETQTPIVEVPWMKEEDDVIEFSHDDAIIETPPDTSLESAEQAEHNDNHDHETTPATTPEEPMDVQDIPPHLQPPSLRPPIVRPHKPAFVPDTSDPSLTKGIVMGRLMSEDTAWVSTHLPQWQNSIYVVDVPENGTSPTNLTTRMNKAKEATPYLTYIVDNYPNFPDVSIFLHSHRSGWPKAWHNDVKGHDAVIMVRNLRMNTVMSRGYVNLRCNGEPGCPAEIRLDRDTPAQEAESAWPFVYAELFNTTVQWVRENVPAVGTPCCAQFAVSRDQILQRELWEYEHYLKVIEDSEYDDETLGTVMEYMWHIMFGKNPVMCEWPESCYAALYGRRI